MSILIKTCICVVMACFIGHQTVQAETKHALLIGISDYGNTNEDPNKWGNIHGANDIILLEPVFVKQGFKVTTLTNQQATYSNIIKALDSINKSSRAGDIVYIHFSMHGQPFEDLNGDEADGWDEALVPIDAQMMYAKGKYEGKNHLLDDTLEMYFNKIRSKLGKTGFLYVTLDACHSGTAHRGDEEYVRGTKDGFSRSGKLYTPDRNKETNDYFRIATNGNQSPIVVLEACRSYQKNSEIREGIKWYGPLSYYISQAMADHTIGKNGVSSNWIQLVKLGMSRDRRLKKQNMVIESSK